MLSDFGDFEAWSDSILNRWNTNHHCLRKDGIVYFTGRAIGVKGVTNKNTYLCEDITLEKGQRVTIIGAQESNWDDDRAGWTVAHELGHQFGLGHEDTDCGQACNDSVNLLMCSSYGYTAALSTCMRGMLNSNFNASRCACLADIIEGFYYTNDDCAICYATVTSIEGDNPHPVHGCGANRDIINLSATLEGGCNPAKDVIVRVRFDPKILKAHKDANGNIISDYFTSEEARYSGGQLIWYELVAREPDNDEKTITLNEGDSEVFDFSLVFDPQAGAEVKKYAVQVYIGLPDHANAGYYSVQPYFDLPVQTGQTVFDVLPLSGDDNYFHILGDLVIPEVPAFPPQARYLTDKPSYVFNDYHLVMHDGKKISVASDVPVLFANSSIEGCAQMWQGILLEPETQVNIRNNSISDAQVAVDVPKGATLIAKTNEFLNNNFGIKTNASGTGNYHITLFGNKFGTTGAELKSAYSGQLPAPFGKGFTGLYLKDAGGINIGADPSGGEPNRFFNLKYGILSFNTQLNVQTAVFEDITQVAAGSGYSGYTNSATGKAVYVEKGLIKIWKGSGQTLSFRNCHTGVETSGATAYVFYTDMSDMTNGIITTNGDYAIHNGNTIEATDRGIELRHFSPFGLPVPADLPTAVGGVYANTIIMDGNPSGVGIHLAGSKAIAVDPNGVTSGPPQFTGGNIASNIITMRDGASAIRINAARRTAVYDNEISLENTQGEIRGIELNAGDRNALSCNTVSGSGAGENTGIYTLHAGQPSVRCNLLTETAEGLHFEGILIGKGKAEISGNSMNNNTTGLLYGVDAISGEQMHRGNRWMGSNSFAQHQGIASVAIQSKYTVDAFEDSEYLPDIWSPILWFIDELDTAETYNCPIAAGLCIKENESGLEPEESLDGIIARGELPGEDYRSMNTWLAQRRLYERIEDEGNPYPGNSDIADFLERAQSNGLAGFATMQSGIRRAFEIRQADQDTLQGYEAQLIGYLDTLAVLDQRFFADDVSEQDSIALSGQRNALLQAVGQVALSKSSLWAEIDSARAVTADSLLAENNNLPETEEAYAANEKTVNDILLRTVALNQFVFSSQDSAMLETIAGRCPLSDGEAVLQARALLALAHAAPRVYHDESNCISERNGAVKTETMGLIRIYPNPVTDEAIVEYAPANNSEQILLIFNTLGQLVRRVELPENPLGKTAISLKNLPEGLYLFRNYNGPMRINSGKIIVNR